MRVIECEHDFFSFFFLFSHTCPVLLCLSVFVFLSLVFSGWVISVNSFFSGFGGGNVCVGGGGCLCVCVCFFHMCYTAPKVSYLLCKDNKIYLTCPVPLSVSLSLSLSNWLVGLLVQVSEREKEP